MPIPSRLQDRIDTFHRNLEAYTAPDYKEARLREEFLNPFFEELGWDMTNRAGYAEAYKDVVHEESLKLSGAASAAPDYSFRIGGTRKFFVEAKKPSVRIQSDPEPAAQLRRYSWSAKLPLGIVTNFTEFAIYDTRVRPMEGDKASAARLFYCGYADYAAKWDEIAGIFSRDAVLKGSFDKYATTSRGKRGTAEFDDEFLKDMETWRELLARNLALRNPGLTQRELNFAVQRILDRVVFLRIAEDRGIEPYGQLQALTAGRNIYPRFCEICERADFRYNSGLFHFAEEKGREESPDKLTLRLTLDDAPLKEILGALYYPKSPYAFAVIPADILGHVYEKFLGKVIHLTAGHRAKVEEKPEVRKAGGVYYTPTYIVDYIVRQTVGPLVEGKTPKQVAKLRVLDPACGSGSFVLGAFQYLLDWHLKYYIGNKPENWAKQKNPPIYQTAPNAFGVGKGSDNWQLTTAERKRILLNNLYGVDIDSQAVEVTKLSLLLKVLEGEAREMRGKQMDFHRVLPDLGKNIKCGNSLIGSDFYAQPDLPTLDEEARYKVNAFDWEHEFKEFMSAGGFDAVIGNPPYVRQESLKESKEYFKTHYKSFDGVADLFVYFIEKNLRLLKSGGRTGIIVSSSFLRAKYAGPLRSFLKANGSLLQIVDFGGLAVFANAKDTYVCIPIMAKSDSKQGVSICRVSTLDFQDLQSHVASHSYEVPQNRLNPAAWSLKSDSESRVFEKILRSGINLGSYIGGRLYYGLKTGLNRAFEISSKERSDLIAECPSGSLLIKPFLGGQEIRRYYQRETDRHLIVIPCGWTRTKMRNPLANEKDAWGWLQREQPSIARHLSQFTEPAKKRYDKGDFWWELRPCDYLSVFDKPKIIFPDIAKSPRFNLDKTGIYLANTAYSIGTDDLYLLGILNSRLFWFAISNISIPFGVRAGQYRYRLIYQYMEQVPIRSLDLKSENNKRLHDSLVLQVQRALRLHQDLPQTRTPDAQTRLQREIAATDRAIDQLVYQLYELTPEEIAVVEEAVESKSKAVEK